MTSRPAVSRKCPEYLIFPAGPTFALQSAMPSKLPRLEVLIGRSLAMCAHPYAAWRSQSARGRALVLVAYMATSYFVVLGALLTF
jgi:hypothetical protein